MGRFRVRFNLARGEKTYRLWQVRDEMGNPSHYDPDKFKLVMTDCKLHNNRNAAENILDGGYRRVCGWIVCSSYEVVLMKEPMVGTKDEHIMYNPKFTPYWVMNGVNMDGTTHELIYTSGRKIYIPQSGLTRG